MKKVLVISYYWPPAGGISVLRSLKIVKYLRKFGWEPIVYAPSNAHYPYADEDNFRDIPDQLTTLKKPILEPFQLFKFLTGRKKTDPLNSIVQVRDQKHSLLDKLGIWIRGNFFIPDARSLWIKPSVRFLKTYLKDNPVDAIFSDGPPHTNTMIACNLKKELGIPWLSDYQDPWTQVDYYKKLAIGKRAHRKHVRMEQEALNAADKITIASPSWKTDLESIGAKNVDVIYYGYDEEDFKDLKKTNDPGTFHVVHTGLLGIDRNPVNLISELNKIKTGKKIRLSLAGQIDFQVKRDIDQNSKNIEINYLGTISRKNALQLAVDADLLLLPLNQAVNAKGRLPGKLYEYLRTYNPILALGPIEGDAAKILEDTNAGKCFGYEDKTGIGEYISNHLNDVRSSPKKDNIAKFSNRKQTSLIAKYLDQITS